MESKKVKLFNISNYNEYVLLSLEKTESAIDLIENFLDDLKLTNFLGDREEYLKLVDKKETFTGQTIAEVIYGKNKFFFITNVQNEDDKSKMMKRVKENTEFVTK